MSLSPSEKRKIGVIPKENFSQEKLIKENRELEQENFSLIRQKLSLVQKFDSFRTRLRIVSISSTLGFLTLGMMYFIKYYNTPNPQKTFKEYFALYQEESSSDRDRGIKAYAEKDFKKAILNLPSDTIMLDAKWFKIESLLEEKEYNLAISLLQDYKTDEARWLYALCLLGSEQNYLAQKTLDSIYQEEGRYSSLARAVLEKHYGNKAYRK